MQHFEFSWKNPAAVDIYAQGWAPDGAADAVKAVIILQHGLGEHSGRYRHVAEFFAQHGIALLANDRSGHGKSGCKRGHIHKYEYVFDDISKLHHEATVRYPDKPVFLYGHSMGGGIVLNYLIRHPKNGLKGAIVTGPLILPAFQPSRIIVGLGKLMRGIFPGFVQNNQVDANKISRDPQVVKTYQQDPLVHDRISAETGVTMLEWGKYILENGKEISIPLLAMHGSADQLTSPKATQDFVRQAKGNITLKIWDGLWHEIHNEPEQLQVLLEIYKWIEGNC